MESIAPLRYAEPWDRVGLLVGDRERAMDGPVFMTIDFTERVLAEAVGVRASAVIAYHPPVWDPLKRITTDTPRQRIMLRAIEAGMAIYSPHTALDAVPGGVTDWLCEGLSGVEMDDPSAIVRETDMADMVGAGAGGERAGGRSRIAGDCRALTAHASVPAGQQVKIVTFVPEKDADQVRSALASAGAGLIGGYQVCSFASMGTGTFLGGAGTSPAVGRAGQLERVAELRLEMVCSKSALPLALETLRRLHPYEEPAVDVYELAAQPVRSAGPGRRLVLDRPATLADLAARLKKFLGPSRVRVAALGGQDLGAVTVTHVGVCPGSGASLSQAAAREGCQVYVTGEMSHHDVMGALHAGMSVIVAGHTNTERGYLPRLAGQLKEKLPEVRVVISGEDRDPLVSV